MTKILFTFLAILATIDFVYPCSVIVLKKGDQTLLAKNFDWTYWEGMIIKNLRGVNKTAYFTHPGEQAQWTSKYGSITFNQNELKNPGSALNELTEPINYSYLSPALIHLGFDQNVAKDISRHQFQPSPKTSSVFSDNYFHFEIAVPLEADKQTGFLAVMDSEQHFNKRQAVTGGFLYGNIGKGTLVVHIYGLKNGTYAMLAFIDENKNKQLDFDKQGICLEKYATFSDHLFTNEGELNFSNTSAGFTKSNAKVDITWKR